MIKNKENVLKFIIYPLPFWWLLGLDQILFYLFGIYTFLIFLIDKRKKLKEYETLLVFFLICTFISAFFVYQPSRLLEVFRSTIAFITLLFGGRFIGQIIAEKGRERVLKYLYILFLWSIFSVLISFFLPDFDWTAPIKFLIPGALQQYSLVSNLYTKSLGDIYFSIFGQFWRPRGIYSYSTALGVTVATLIPMVHLYKHFTKTVRWINIAIWFGIIVILLTTTRIALIAIIGIYCFYGLFVYKQYRKYILSGMVVSLVTILFMVDVIGLFNAFMEIRGGGSLSFRMSLYGETFNFFARRPVFGWGAQIPHEQFYAALGSHSSYINFLLCYGVIGFVLFIIASLNCFSNLRWSKKSDMLLIGSWISFAIVSLTQVFHVDFITVFVITNLYALSVYRISITKKVCLLSEKFSLKGQDTLRE